jgi:hypothetical protein
MLLVMASGCVRYVEKGDFKYVNFGFNTSIDNAEVSIDPNGHIANIKIGKVNSEAKALQDMAEAVKALAK